MGGEVCDDWSNRTVKEQAEGRLRLWQETLRARAPRTGRMREEDLNNARTNSDIGHFKRGVYLGL